MKIKLIKKYWDDRYEYHITTPSKDIQGKEYDYVSKRICRLNVSDYRAGLPNDQKESDEEFSIRAIRIFDEFVQEQKNKKEDFIVKQVNL